MTTFTDGIFNGVENFFSTSGRMSRSAYWWFALFCVLVTGGISLLVLVANGYSEGTAKFINILADVTFWYVMIVPGIRRLHDIDKASSNALWVLLPFIGWAYLIYLFCQPSDPDENYWGYPTR